MMIDADIQQRVRQTHLFSVLDEAQLQQVLTTLEIWTLQEGESVFVGGQQAKYFFLVLEGQVKLYRMATRGREKVIMLIGPDQLFAEGVMFLERHHYPINAMALETTRLCAFDNATFVGLLKDSTSLCFALMFQMSRRLHGLINEIDYLTLQNANFRVARYLLDLLAAQETESTTIQLPTSKSVIASRLSIKPETFSRILRQLNEQGIATTAGQVIQIHDLQRLREIIHYSSGMT